MSQPALLRSTCRVPGAILVLAALALRSATAQTSVLAPVPVPLPVPVQVPVPVPTPGFPTLPPNGEVSVRNLHHADGFFSVIDVMDVFCFTPGCSVETTFEVPAMDATQRLFLRAQTATTDFNETGEVVEELRVGTALVDNNCQPNLAGSCDLFECGRYEITPLVGTAGLTFSVSQTVSDEVGPEGCYDYAQYTRFVFELQEPLVVVEPTATAPTATEDSRPAIVQFFSREIGDIFPVWSIFAACLGVCLLCTLACCLCRQHRRSKKRHFHGDLDARSSVTNDRPPPAADGPTALLEMGNSSKGHRIERMDAPTKRPPPPYSESTHFSVG